MPVLVKCDFNWADEMDLRGFWIEKGSLEEAENGLKFDYCYRQLDDWDAEHDEPLTEVDPAWLNEPFEFGIGTNQDMYYSDFDSYRSGFVLTEITQEEYDVINKLFGSSFGILLRC